MAASTATPIVLIGKTNTQLRNARSLPGSKGSAVVRVADMECMHTQVLVLGVDQNSGDLNVLSSFKAGMSSPAC